MELYPMQFGVKNLAARTLEREVIIHRINASEEGSFLDYKYFLGLYDIV